VRVDDSEWSAVGETVGLSAPAGAAVKVVGVRDGLLVVAPMDSETAPGVGAADPSGSGTP
jgi:membrane-bound ClpP family serine protease